MATILIHWPGLPGQFIVDDVDNLSLLNIRGGITSWEALLTFVFGNTSGFLGRPVAMLSFLLNDQYYPGDVQNYRFTNLMIHCLCGVILFVFSQRFLSVLGKGEKKANQIALITTIWWLLAPLNISTTLYIIQRMTQLSTLFILIGLIYYLHGREQLDQNSKRGWVWVGIGLFGFGGLAVLSKENGALIFIYAGACEVAIYNTRRGKTLLPLWAVLVIPLIGIFVFFVYRWNAMMGGYQFRDFSLIERLLTQTRILWDYLLKMVMPFSGKMGLIYDDYTISRSLFSPWSTLLSVVTHCLSVVIAWHFRKIWPITIFAVIWFYGGHLLESTIIPLELYFEHRNYLPMIGVLLAITATLWEAELLKVLGRTVLLFLIIAAVFMCSQRAKIWGDPKWQVSVWAAEHPNSIRAQMGLVNTLLVQGNYNRATRLLNEMKMRWPEKVHIDLMMLNQHCLGNMTVSPSLADIQRMPVMDVMGGMLNPVLEQTMGLFSNNVCVLLSGKDMHSLFDRLNTNEQVLPSFKAKIHFWDAKVYTKEGNLNGAMLALDEAMAHQRNSIFRFSQAELLYSSGLYNDAFEYIDKALDIEKEKVLFKQQNISLYNQLREKILENVTTQ